MTLSSQVNSRAILGEIAARFGTPCYAYDAERLRRRAAHLRDLLPESVEIFYSLKANATLGVSEVLAECELGADVASAGELLTADAAGFPANRMFVAGPHKAAETVAWLNEHPQAVVSVDSPFELDLLARAGLENQLALRLRPEFESRACVAAGCDSRFGFRAADFAATRRRIEESRLSVIGFHIFAGSQVLDAAHIIEHLEESFRQSRRAADALGVPLEFLNLGGGFGIPYGTSRGELDLAAVGEALGRIQASADGVRLALEIGRYLVAQAGWYLTSVVGRQVHRERPAVIVDGGTHQRADLCGLDLRTSAAPPVVVRPARSSPGGREAGAQLSEQDVLGCLSLPADVLSEGCRLPELEQGDVLAYANAGAYGLWASATNFHAYPLPAEVLFDGSQIELLRERRSPASILDGQRNGSSRALPGNW